MKRTKWYRFKNPESGHVIYCTIDTTVPHDEWDSYYKIVGRYHATRRERKGLHIYRSENGHVAKSKIVGLNLNVDIFDSQGEVYDDIPLKMVK